MSQESDATPGNWEAAKAFLTDALRLYAESANEEVLKQNVVSHLPRIFPTSPPWVAHHVRGAESMVGYIADGQRRRGFIDNLVGYTTIEYEHDLNTPSVFRTGFGQVHQHLAGRLNVGAPEDKLIGILSDTLHWRAYRIASVRPNQGGGPVGPDDLTLVEVGRLDLTSAGDFEAEQLCEFLLRYLGREGSLPLSASSLADDLGFDSPFCAPHLVDLRTLVEAAIGSRPEYAQIVKRLWTEFVAYLGDGLAAGGFDQEVYVDELYLVTLAKLICANVVSGTGLHSTQAELADILDGDFFKTRGLLNVVEYDFFGWFNSAPHLTTLLGVALLIVAGNNPRTHGDDTNMRALS